MIHWTDLKLALLTLYAFLPGFFNHLPIWLQRDVKSGHKGPTIWLLRGVWRFQKNISGADWFQEKKNFAMKFQGDTNPPILAGKLLFSANISGLSFLHNILPDFETLPSQWKIMFSLFNQSFLAWFFAVFLWFLNHFYPFGISKWACDNFRCGNALLRLEYLYAKSWTWH